MRGSHLKRVNRGVLRSPAVFAPFKHLRSWLGLVLASTLLLSGPVSGDSATCHGERGEGNGTKFYPLVAGQHFVYLLREARMVRDGERGNANPDMVRVIKPYSDEDLEAVADYMSRLNSR